MKSINTYSPGHNGPKLDKIDNNRGIGLDNGLPPIRQQAIIWNSANLVNWRIYAALGEDELKQQPLSWVSFCDLFHFSIFISFTQSRRFIDDIYAFQKMTWLISPEYVPTEVELNTFYYSSFNVFRF